MSYRSPSPGIDPLHAQSMGFQPPIQTMGNQGHVFRAWILKHRRLTYNRSLPVIPSQMGLQQHFPQQIPQYMSMTTAPIPIPINAGSMGQQMSYGQQPYQTTHSFPMYGQQMPYGQQPYHTAQSSPMYAQRMSYGQQPSYQTVQSFPTYAQRMSYGRQRYHAVQSFPMHAQQMSYGQQPYQTAQSFPMYAQQLQSAGYPSSTYASGYGYDYGTPASTQYAPGSLGGSYLQDRSPSPRRHHHRHRHGHRDRHGIHGFLRRRTYSDPEHDGEYSDSDPEYDGQHWGR